MPFLHASDITMRYEVTGPASAPVVMLANSLGTDLHLWDAQAGALASVYRVLRYDMRGHGATDVGPVSEGTTIDRLADDALALLDALEIGRVHFCGLSIGGMVAQRAAAKAPERVASVALCDTAMQIGPPAVWDDRIAAVEQGGMAAVVDGVLARWFTPQTHAARPTDVRGTRNVLLRTPAAGYIACARAVRDADLRADAAAIRCPALVIVGDQDPATPPSSAAALHAAVRGSRLEVIAGAAHLSNVEQPAAFNAALLAFLRSLEAANGAGDAFERGRAVRSAVLGEAYVERALGDADDFTRDFQEWITCYAWDGVWARPQLERRVRSMLTVGLLAALGHHAELRLHVRAARDLGVTRDELREVLLHTAVYAGVPAANAGFREARRALSDEEKP